MFWIKWLIAKIKSGELVYLRYYDGEVETSIAYKNPWGELVAERRWPLNVAKVILLPNGKVGMSCVKDWKCVNERKSNVQ